MKPLFLKLENFFSHKQSEIDFKQFDSALLLGSIDGDYSKSNGSGKSAIFEAILWCLFNKIFIIILITKVCFFHRP